MSFAAGSPSRPRSVHPHPGQDQTTSRRGAASALPQQQPHHGPTLDPPAQASQPISSYHGAVTEPGGPVVLRTLADYQAFTLSAFCQACDRSVALDHQAVADRWGWGVLLQDIRRRLRCEKCGRRAQRVLVGYSQAAVPDG